LQQFDVVETLGTPVEQIILPFLSDLEYGTLMLKRDGF